MGNCIHYLSESVLGQFKACACGILSTSTNATTEREQVTCEGCMRTRTFRGLPERIPLWVEELRQNLPMMSNRDLLDEVLDLAGGDDYDGCHTGVGWRTYQELLDELEKRLGNWLKE